MLMSFTLHPPIISLPALGALPTTEAPQRGLRRLVFIPQNRNPVFNEQCPVRCVLLIINCFPNPCITDTSQWVDTSGCGARGKEFKFHQYFLGEDQSISPGAGVVVLLIRPATHAVFNKLYSSKAPQKPGTDKPKYFEQEKILRRFL